MIMRIDGAVRGRHPLRVRAWAWILAATAALGGCAARRAAAPPAPVPDPPVLVNHTPFSTTVALATTEEQGYFYTALQKVTLRLFPDGSTRFAQDQERLSEMPRALSPACSEVRACVVPSELGPFRVKAEVYLDAREGVATPRSWVSVDGVKQETVLLEGQAVFPEKESFLVPYPSAGSAIVVGGLAGGEEVRFRIPQGFHPFTLVRYKGGEIVPVPARADTVVIDPKERRLTLVYHSTFSTRPPIRQVEFRALVPPEFSAFAATEEARVHAVAMTAYLTACPVPTAPVEVCSGPRPAVDRALLLNALLTLVEKSAP